MSKKTNKEWRLDPSEVTSGMHMSTSGKSGQLERKLKKTSTNVFLKHLPTGIEAVGEVPLGNYSKKEMQQHREKLKQKLFAQLESAVAKHLKVKGR